MELVIGVTLAVAAGVLVGSWTARRRTRNARRPVRVPADAKGVLEAYRRAEYEAVAAGAPVAARALEDDPTWSARLDLVWGHSLFQLDRFDEAIAHLERGLAAGVTTEGEARFRHCLGYSYQSVGRTDAARRVYESLLADDDLDPSVRDAVRGHLSEIT